MPTSITDQIGKYKAAVGKRNVGSDPSPEQMANAKNTAIGRMNGTIKRSPGSTSLSMSVSGKPRGSWEGYQHANSAYIKPNGSGYDNKSLQKARYSDRTLAVKKVQASQFKERKLTNCVKDYCMKGSNRSSISKLNKIAKKKII